MPDSAVLEGISHTVELHTKKVPGECVHTQHTVSQENMFEMMIRSVNQAGIAER